MIIKSKKGIEMMDTISSIYELSSIMQSIYEAIGREVDSLDNLNEDLIMQLFPQTATWGLSFWERRLNLTSNKDEDLEIRRGKVLAKLQSKYTINPERFAQIIKNQTGAIAQIIEDVAPYIFKVKADVRNVKDATELSKIIKKVKPSHLGFILELFLISETHLFIGATTVVGQTVTLLPYDLDDIVTSKNINIFGAITHSSQRVTIL